MNKWNRFNRGECPVCQGTRKDCRQNTQTNLIHCRDTNANPIDYIFRGDDALGFGMWAYKPDAEAWKDERREEWIRQKQLEREIRQRQEQKRTSRLLTIEERDQEIRRILDQLTLSQRHRQMLKNRGLSDAEIDQGGFRTVSPWQKLTQKINPNLAGVNKQGNRLTNPLNGILCPILDHNGHYLGFQYRNDKNLDHSKYLWPKGQKRGITVHLKENQELPLSYHQGTGNIPFNLEGKKAVALAEGTHIKPYLCALRTGLDTIGAAGGLFATSPQQLYKYLQHSGAELVILFADGGSLINRQVLKQYRKTVKLIQNWGIEIKIAYWEQITKNSPDIDELNRSDYQQIQFLTPTEFFSIAQKEQYWHRVIEAQQKITNLTYPPNLLIHQKYLGDIYEQLPKTGEIYLKAYKGAGKSWTIKQLIQMAKQEKKDICSVVPRIVLGLNQAQVWEINYISQLDNHEYGVSMSCLLENIDSLSLCLNSLWKLKERDFSNTILVLDECEQIFTHAIQSETCRQKLPLILAVLAKAIRECDLVIASDADLTDISVKYISALRKEKANPFIVLNTFLPERCKIYQLHSQEEIYFKIEQAIEAGENIIIATDSKDEAQSMEQVLLEKYPQLRRKIININSDTTETDWAKDFVQQINLRIREHQPRVLIHTNSLGTGVSIDVQGHFHKLFTLFLGVITSNHCRQLLFRLRANIDRYVYIAHKGIKYNSDYIPEDIKENLELNCQKSLNISNLATAITQVELGEEVNDYEITQTLSGMVNPVTKTWDNAHIDLYCAITARTNYNLSQLSLIFWQQMEEEGHLIINSHSDESLGQEIKNCKEEIRQREAQQIANQVLIDELTAKKIERKPNKTKQERQKLLKYQLQQQLPSLEITPEFIEQEIFQNRYQRINAIKLHWYAQNPEIAIHLDTQKTIAKLKQWTIGEIFIADYYTHSAKIDLLRQLGIFELLDNQQTYHNLSPELKKLKEKALFHRREIKAILNRKISPKISPVKLLSTLLAFLDISLIGQQKREGKKRTWYYKINRDYLKDPLRLQLEKGLNQKYASFLASKESEPVTEEPITNRDKTGGSVTKEKVIPIPQNQPYTTKSSLPVSELRTENSQLRTEEDKLNSLQETRIEEAVKSSLSQTNNTDECCTSNSGEKDSPLIKIGNKVLVLVNGICYWGIVRSIISGHLYGVNYYSFDDNSLLGYAKVIKDEIEFLDNSA